MNCLHPNDETGGPEHSKPNENEIASLKEKHSQREADLMEVIEELKSQKASLMLAFGLVNMS